MSADDVKGVHLFVGSTLLANLETTKDVPDPRYRIAETSYEVISYLTITEADGRRGFDVQLRALEPPTP